MVLGFGKKKDDELIQQGLNVNYADEMVNTSDVKRWKELTRAELFNNVVQPDLSDKIMIGRKPTNTQDTIVSDVVSRLGKRKGLTVEDVAQAVLTRLNQEKQNQLDTRLSSFTKELKTSFLTMKEIMIVEELADIARTASNIGAYEFAIDMLHFRDIMLSVAPSRDATLLKLMNTEFSIKHIGVENKSKKFFQRKEEER
jgi:hypothetical protein